MGVKDRVLGLTLGTSRIPSNPFNIRMTREVKETLDFPSQVNPIALQE